MAKPDLKSQPEDKSFLEWSELMTKFASFKNVYVKYSGLPSYLPSEDSQEDLTNGILSAMPWVQRLVELFGAERIVWGSDWPVCDVNDVSSREGNWGTWRRASQILLEQCNLTPSQLEDIFHNNVVRIYQV